MPRPAPRAHTLLQLLPPLRLEVIDRLHCQRPHVLPAPLLDGVPHSCRLQNQQHVLERLDEMHSRTALSTTADRLVSVLVDGAEQPQPEDGEVGRQKQRVEVVQEDLEEQVGRLHTNIVSGTGRGRMMGASAVMGGGGRSGYGSSGWEVGNRVEQW